jgi:hypothetical protein
MRASKIQGIQWNIIDDTAEIEVKSQMWSCAHCVKIQVPFFLERSVFSQGKSCVEWRGIYSSNTGFEWISEFLRFFEIFRGRLGQGKSKKIERTQKFTRIRGLVTVVLQFWGGFYPRPGLLLPGPGMVAYLLLWRLVFIIFRHAR